MRKQVIMRKPHMVLLVAAVLLSVGWARASRTARQDCCHPSAAKSPKFPATSAAPMTALSTDDVRKEFNASSEKVRVVALLSPTCPGCQSGHAVVGRVLKKFPSPKLQAILVWEPMRDGDNAAIATQQAENVRDVRIKQGWDGTRNLGKLFGDALNIHQVAWDVYLVYKPGVKWEGAQPPRPTFWMHQLEGVDPNLLLCVNPTRLSEEVGKLIAQSN